MTGNYGNQKSSECVCVLKEVHTHDLKAFRETLLSRTKSS